MARERHKETKEAKDREQSEREGRRELVDESTVFSFSFFTYFFFFFRLFCFLTAAMCLISDVICSRPGRGGEGLTLGKPPSTRDKKTSKHNTTEKQQFHFKTNTVHKKEPRS